MKTFNIKEMKARKWNYKKYYLMMVCKNLLKKGQLSIVME